MITCLYENFLGLDLPQAGFCRAGISFASAHQGFCNPLPNTERFKHPTKSQSPPAPPNPPLRSKTPPQEPSPSQSPSRHSRHQRIQRRTLRTRRRGIKRPRPNHPQQIPLFTPRVLPYTIRVPVYKFFVRRIRRRPLQNLQVAHEDALELRTVVAAVWFAGVVQDAVGVAEGGDGGGGDGICGGEVGWVWVG